MKATSELQVASKQERCSTKEFVIAAKSIQLDACFAFLMTSPTPPDRLPTFCELLFNSVAGPDAVAVREQLSGYLKIRRSEKGEEGLLDILLVAANRLRDSSNGNGSDPLDLGWFITVLLELIRQGVVAAQELAIPLPPVDKWQERC